MALRDVHGQSKCLEKLVPVQTTKLALRSLLRGLLVAVSVLGSQFPIERANL